MKNNNTIGVTNLGLFLVLIVAALFLFNQHAYASIGGTPVPKDCTKAGGWELQNGSSCWWTTEAQYNGINVIRANTQFTSNSNGALLNQFDNYVPYSGMWMLRTYMCPTTTAIACTIAESSGYVDSAATLELSSTITIADSSGTWGGATGKIPSNTSICYTYVDTRAPSIAWGTNALRTCQDAQKLPDVPADCYVNGGGVLNVDLGILERSEIPTEPDVNNSMAQSRSVVVLCTRDAGTTVTTKFKFTPINIGGHNVISGGNGMGIAVYYNGTLADADQEFPAEHFEQGYTNIGLTFVPVRDANKPKNSITVGDFSASAVLEMTEQ